MLSSISMPISKGQEQILMTIICSPYQTQSNRQRKFIYQIYNYQQQIYNPHNHHLLLFNLCLFLFLFLFLCQHLKYKIVKHRNHNKQNYKSKKILSQQNNNLKLIQYTQQQRLIKNNLQFKKLKQKNIYKTRKNKFYWMKQYQQYKLNLKMSIAILIYNYQKKTMIKRQIQNKKFIVINPRNIKIYKQRQMSWNKNSKNSNKNLKKMKQKLMTQKRLKKNWKIKENTSWKFDHKQTTLNKFNPFSYNQYLLLMKTTLNLYTTDSKQSNVKEYFSVISKSHQNFFTKFAIHQFIWKGNILSLQIAIGQNQVHLFIKELYIFFIWNQFNININMYSRSSYFKNKQNKTSASLTKSHESFKNFYYKEKQSEKGRFTSQQSLTSLNLEQSNLILTDSCSQLSCLSNSSNNAFEKQAMQINQANSHISQKIRLILKQQSKIIRKLKFWLQKQQEHIKISYSNFTKQITNILLSSEHKLLDYINSIYINMLNSIRKIKQMTSNLYKQKNCQENKLALRQKYSSINGSSRNNKLLYDLQQQQKVYHDYYEAKILYANPYTQKIEHQADKIIAFLNDKDIKINQSNICQTIKQQLDKIAGIINQLKIVQN